MRWKYGASAFALMVLVAGAAEATGEARVVVRFSPRLLGSEADRIASAMRAQLRDAATVAGSFDGGHATCVVDVDRTETGIVLRFTDAAGKSAGPPRFVGPGGEIAASEAAAIVRAFVVAALERDAATASSSVTAATPANPAPGQTPARSDPAVSETARQAREQPLEHARLRAAEVASNAETVSAVPAAAYAWRGRVGAFYTASTYAPQRPWQSGIRIEGAYAFLRRWPALYAGAGYAFFPRTEVANDAAAVDVSRHSASLFLGIDGGGRTIAVAADLGAGVDDSQRSTARTTGAFVKTSDASTLDLVLVARLHGRLRLPQSRGFALDVAPAFELAPGTRSLAVQDGEATATLLAPALMRFRLDIGGTFDGF